MTSEFSLGSSSVRADLAILADEFIGIEIKSASDTLRRLPYQAAAYSTYFDRVAVVVAECHLAQASAMDLWGASLWVLDDQGIVTVTVDAGPSAEISPASYFDLMTQYEIRRFMRDAEDGVSTTRNKLRQGFRDAFYRRYSATSEAFWKHVSRRNIQPDDLSLLSRFHDQRREHRRLQNEKTQKWSRWASYADTSVLELSVA